MKPHAVSPEDAPGQLEALLDGRLPDARGRFGPWGGRFVPETLVPALDRLQAGVTAPAFACFPALPRARSCATGWAARRH
jgi:hypothetical protein